MIVVLWAFAAPAMATPTPQAACALFSPELLANASGSPTVAQIWWDARTMPLVGLLECAEQFPEQRARALAWMGPVLDAWLLPGGPAELGLEGHPWRPRWGACDIAGVPPLLYLLARRAANASIDAEVVSAFADYWLRNKNLLPSGAAARVNGGHDGRCRPRRPRRSRTARPSRAACESRGSTTRSSATRCSRTPPRRRPTPPPPPREPTRPPARCSLCTTRRSATLPTAGRLNMAPARADGSAPSLPHHPARLPP